MDAALTPVRIPAHWPLHRDLTGLVEGKLLQHVRDIRAARWIGKQHMFKVSGAQP